MRWVSGVLLLALAPAVGANDPEPPFTDVTANVGLDFVHFNGASGRFYYPEVVGSGGALLDYDNDGDLDLYLVQGAMLGPDLSLADALMQPPPSTSLTDRLYRNDLVVAADGGRDLRFTDVTTASGISASGYGLGVAVGDFDNDGWVDLYVTNFGSNELWRNRGDGTFEEVSRAAGVDDPGWGVSAAFLDYDADGWLDLMVGNYVDFSYAVHQVCTSERGEPDYCLPSAFRPAANRLYRNLGNGTFRDVTRLAGLSERRGNSLGVVSGDFNGDGRLDIYVANDLNPNSLWLNQGDGTFVEDGLLAGCALNADGEAEASMGVTAGDVDGDGDLDLFMTHFSRESNTLYINDGEGFFEDRSERSGLGRPSWPHTSFGTGWLDYDLDGDLDLVVVSGAVTFPSGVDRTNHLFPLDEPNQLYRNLGDGRFEDVTALAGPLWAVSEISRGAILGDVDNDGDTDLVITNNSGPARLLRNNADVSLPWLGLRLVGEDGVRDMLGARVAIDARGPSPLWRRSRTDGSYASAHDPRIVAALPAAGGRQAVEVRVEWLDGRKESFRDVPLGRYTTLQAGDGVVAR